jgi:hypothetical protein
MLAALSNSLRGRKEKKFQRSDFTPRNRKIHRTLLPRSEKCDSCVPLPRGKTVTRVAINPFWLMEIFPASGH